MAAHALAAQRAAHAAARAVLPAGHGPRSGHALERRGQAAFERLHMRTHGSCQAALQIRARGIGDAANALLERRQAHIQDAVDVRAQRKLPAASCKQQRLQLDGSVRHT